MFFVEQHLIYRPLELLPNIKASWGKQIWNLFRLYSYQYGDVTMCNNKLIMLTPSCFFMKQHLKYMLLELLPNIKGSSGKQIWNLFMLYSCQYGDVTMYSHKLIMLTPSCFSWNNISYIGYWNYFQTSKGHKENKYEIYSCFTLVNMVMLPCVVTN